ncbi:MAG: hypothetical protein FWD84_03290 [Oscillospiraceae bacterium]|nr:hypothetical protein [Oscillospiraceae bacterium]
MKEVSNEVKHAFAGWLVSTYSGSFDYTIGKDYYTIIRVCKNETFDYLYTQRHHNGLGLKRRSDLDYAGIYCNQDGLLYDDQYRLQELIDGTIQSPEDLRSQLKEDVCQAVEAQINDDRRNLQISELASDQKRKDLAYYQERPAMDEARNAYLFDTYHNEGHFSFRCDYDPDCWTEDSLLAYILNPAQYTVAEVDAYMGSHQEDMLFHFLYMDAVSAAYADILNTPLAPVHKVKRIMAAMNDSSAKTVTVTIRKGGIEFTFKTEAHRLRRDCTCTYSTWDILAADRREFERLFGRAASYRPEDILRITYARSVLYQI